MCSSRNSPINSGLRKNRSPAVSGFTDAHPQFPILLLLYIIYFHFRRHLRPASFLVLIHSYIINTPARTQNNNFKFFYSFVSPLFCSVLFCSHKDIIIISNHQGATTKEEKEEEEEDDEDGTALLRDYASSCGPPLHVLLSR